MPSVAQTAGARRGGRGSAAGRRLSTRASGRTRDVLRSVRGAPERARPAGQPRRVLLLTQNNSVPSDRRVWNEITTLRESGYHVTAICPRGEKRDVQAFERREGVDIYRFAQASSAGGIVG